MEMKTGTGFRATTLDELETILGKIFTEESFRHGLAFQPRPTDVIVSPHGKSGTTWLQHIAHGLRTRGSMAFDEITAVTPWIEVAYDLGWDLEAPQVAEPRVFKSHLSWTDIPKGGRYICAFRHPYDVFISFFRFFEGWFVQPGSISLEALTRWRWQRGDANERGYWQHLSSWWEQRHNPNVLLLCYEDMKEDLPGTVRRVARLMGIPLDDELLEIVVRQSSREFMLAHQYHFDEKYMRRAAEERAGLAPNGDSAKVTPGAGTDTRYQLSPTLKAECDARWRAQIELHLGFKDYDELRQAMRELHASHEEPAGT